MPVLFPSVLCTHCECPLPSVYVHLLGEVAPGNPLNHFLWIWLRSIYIYTYEAKDSCSIVQ